MVQYAIQRTGTRTAYASLGRGPLFLREAARGELEELPEAEWQDRGAGALRREASRGSEVIDILERADTGSVPDVVIIDTRMPETDGERDLHQGSRWADVC